MIMYIHISYHVDYNPSGNLFIYIIIPVFNIAAILLLVVGQNTRDDDYSHRGINSPGQITTKFLLQVHSMGDLLRMIYTFSNVVIY